MAMLEMAYMLLEMAYLLRGIGPRLALLRRSTLRSTTLSFRRDAIPALVPRIPPRTYAPPRTYVLQLHPLLTKLQVDRPLRSCCKVLP